LTIVGTPLPGDSFGLYLNYPNAGQTQFEFCGHTQGPCRSGTFDKSFTWSQGLSGTGTYRYERFSANGAEEDFKSGQVPLGQNFTTSATYTY
jgi:hypothetical protein